MKYFDVHTHTNYASLDSQAAEIARECKKLNISYIDVGTDINTSMLAIRHARESQNVYACVGIHPNDVSRIDVNIAISEMEILLEENTAIVAIGETGLDYHYPGYNADEQKRVFLEHIK
jgi:TatD DNase family protein